MQFRIAIRYESINETTNKKFFSFLRLSFLPAYAEYLLPELSML